MKVTTDGAGFDSALKFCQVAEVGGTLEVHHKASTGSDGEASKLTLLCFQTNTGASVRYMLTAEDARVLSQAVMENPDSGEEEAQADDGDGYTPTILGDSVSPTPEPVNPTIEPPADGGDDTATAGGTE